MSGIMAMLLGRLAAGGGLTVVQTFTASGTWTAPTGVTEVEYLVVAAGGGGMVAVVAVMIQLTALLVVQVVGLDTHKLAVLAIRQVHLHHKEVLAATERQRRERRTMLAAAVVVLLLLAQTQLALLQEMVALEPHHLFLVAA